MFEGILLAPQKARNVPDGITIGAWYQKGAKITATELQGTWLHLGTVNGIATTGWLNAGANQSLISFQVVAAPPPPPPPVVTVQDNWTVVIDELSNGTDNVKVSKNGAIVSDVTK
jgi:hypothetical protein